MKKKRKVVLGFIFLLVIFCSIRFFFHKESSKGELVSIRSEKELEKIYQGNTIDRLKEMVIKIIGLPISLLDPYQSTGNFSVDEFDMVTNSVSSSQKGESSSKDYSTTNIQVENVDEADITKTDGDYIYSISGNDVVITDVKEPEQLKIASKISINEGIPQDLILYQDKLVVIAVDQENGISYHRNVRSNTIIQIYEVANRENPVLIKSCKIAEPYQTTRCIGSKLYVISSGTLKYEDDEIDLYYQEDHEKVKIDLENIQYLKDVKTKTQTIFTKIDLNRPEDKVQIHSYLMDFNNCYISTDHIYLLAYQYEYVSDVPPISSLFGLKGAIGPFVYEQEEKNKNGYKTKIYKFDLLEDGEIVYRAKTKIDGRTINQFSLDEYEENLRVALYDNNGSRIVVFDKDLKEIGRSSNLAKGETMYSSRFMGNRAYLVTYKTTDPLFVLDLQNPRNIKVLGELKIPGYSTYLHPYDENHLIGIGMETEEKINRNANGVVISTTSQIVGMKMALFDVTNVNHPIQISNTVIGDRRTTSAILTNHKALLFSKEKGLLAIPVNQYQEEFSVNHSSENYSSMINAYQNYSKSYVAEGYFVYDIHLQDGFQLKGIINHEKKKTYSYSFTTKLLRGLYIDDNLYTVSESAIKVNKLSDLELVDELKID